MFTLSILVANMSKRCCAKDCYNSQTTNRQISYFGFPKHNKLSQQWAIAAGREDLLVKTLPRIIKYYLCAEHFSDECFVVGSNKSVLKKNHRPVWVPIPTIFKNNFDKQVSKRVFEYDGYETSPSTPSPRKGKTPAARNRATETAKGSPSHSIQRPIVVIEMDHNFYDAVETSDMKTEEDSDDNSLAETIETIPCVRCRLCAELIDTCENLIPIFDGTNNVQLYLDRLMPNSIFPDDGLPQQICPSCYEKAESCIIIMNSFKKAQKTLRIFEEHSI